MKQNRKYFGNAVQAILDTITETYCVQGEDGINSIVNLLNTAEDMAFMWDLKELYEVENQCRTINLLLKSDNSEYRIFKEECKYKSAILL